ncbi:MAG: zf-HC2 domain-containing protein [Magnetococcus sp. YQC-5]
METEPAQQLAVLLTLAAGRSEGAGSCPSPESLAALVDGTLHQNQREALLNHLDRCRDCYRAWLGTAAMVPSQPIGKLVVFPRSFKRPALGVMAMAASLVLVLGVWDLFVPDLPGMLTTAYQTVLLEDVPKRVDLTKPVFKSGQEKTQAFGFAHSDAPTPGRLAFTAGANRGWEMLKGLNPQEESTVDPKWMVYHHLGRWVTLLQTICQATPQPMHLLRQQAPLGQALGRLLAKREKAGEVEARIPWQEVDLINQLLHQPGTAEPTPRLCHQIQQACATITEGLSL